MHCIQVIHNFEEFPAVSYTLDRYFFFQKATYGRVIWDDFVREVACHWPLAVISDL